MTDHHSHRFLADSHNTHERRVWAVITLCGLMMLAEIIGGTLFGSIALIADGLHMSTHAGALLLAALAYTYASRHKDDPRFAWGTGKLGDLAGFASAIVLACIAALVAYEAVSRLLHPIRIHFDQAIPIAGLGLAVNIASALLLGAHEHDHHHDDHDHHHDHATHRDNNMRAAIVHVIADAAVSVLVIFGLVLAKFFGLIWMDPLAGLTGAAVIASWSLSLLHDTGKILLDMSTAPDLAANIRAQIEADGSTVRDLHLWRLGPGHLGMILLIEAASPLHATRDAAALRRQLTAHHPLLSHITIEYVGTAA
jgi:cation diffusion facilitator family transporter